MTAALRQIATGRNVLIALGVVAILVLLSNLVLVPVYRVASAGFVPLDLQFPLSQTTIAFQRGAFGPGIYEAYLWFAILDWLSAVAMAVATVVLWSWLSVRAPDGFDGSIVAAGILFLPVLTALSDFAENIYFMRLVTADSHDPQHELTLMALVAHRFHYVLNMVVNGVTLGMFVLAAVATFLRRGRRR